MTEQPSLTPFETLVQAGAITSSGEEFSEEAKNLINQLTPDEMNSIISVNNKLAPCRDEITSHCSAPVF
jgi:hypothetical protein